MVLIFYWFGVHGQIVIKLGTCPAIGLHRGFNDFMNLLQRMLDIINIREHFADLSLSRHAIRVLALLMVKGSIGLGKVEDGTRV